MAVEKERAVFVRNLPVCPLPDLEELLYELFLQVSQLHNSQPLRSTESESIVENE